MRYFLFISVLMLGCSTQTESTTETTAEPTAAMEETQDPYIRLYNEGYDFYATGNEPFWNLAMDFDKKEMKYYRMEGKEIILTIEEEIKAQDANVVMYRGKDDSGTLAVTVNQTNCSDTMSDETRPFKVSIQYIPDEETTTEFAEYTGCGNYLADPRIHNIWTITAINDQQLLPADFPNGMPRMELFNREGRVLGFDGCNTFRGSYYVKNEEFYFGAMATTLMACEGKDVGQDIGKIVHFGKLGYEFKDNQLIISRGENKIVLQATD